jgi:hypothetical protein
MPERAGIWYDMVSMPTIPPLLAAPAILPPFLGSDPADPSARSPYRASIGDVVRRFATSQPRIDILRGLLEYRKELRRLRVGAEFQWLAGSFVENPGREPRDVDVVTFYQQTAAQMAEIRADSERWQRLQALAKSPRADFFCDAYLVNMVGPGSTLVAQTHYWYGLFSHQRGTLAWKGMLEVTVGSSEEDWAAENMLARVAS